MSPCLNSIADSRFLYLFKIKIQNSEWQQKSNLSPFVLQFGSALEITGHKINTNLLV